MKRREGERRRGEMVEWEMRRGERSGEQSRGEGGERGKSWKEGRVRKEEGGAEGISRGGEGKGEEEMRDERREE